jgi:hypothetical protein
MHKCIDMKTSQTLLFTAVIILVTNGVISCSKKSSHPGQSVSTGQHYYYHPGEFAGGILADQH